MDRPARRDHGGGVVIRRLVVKTLVRAVVVVVASELAQDYRGVTFVVDQYPVGALGTDAADEPLGIAVCLRHPERVCALRRRLRWRILRRTTGRTCCPDPGSRNGSGQPGHSDP